VIGSRILYIVAAEQYLPFKDDEFDVVYSNSVIEHLGDPESQRMFADECGALGSHYYIQTPNEWFPIEPHFIAPFIHWFPRVIQRDLLRNFTVRGLLTRPTQEPYEARLREICLLDGQELRQLFRKSGTSAFWDLQSHWWQSIRGPIGLLYGGLWAFR
jgi:hypothetical protein